MKNLLLIFVCLSMTSCMKLIFAYHGVHQPRVESIENIEKLLLEANVQSEVLLGTRFEKIEYVLNHKASEDILFDRNGYMIKYNSQFANESCNGNISKLLPSLPKITYYERDSSLTINNESENWEIIKGKKGQNISKEIELGTYDYFLISYWNLFSGKPNHIKRISRLKEDLEKNQQVKIKHLLINQDFREGMDIELDTK
jgi:hypothetical protein